MKDSKDFERPLVLTSKEVAALLKISDTHLRVLLHRDESKLPPYILIGDHRRWYLPEVEKWMKRNSGHWKRVPEHGDLSLGSLQGKCTGTD